MNDAEHARRVAAMRRVISGAEPSGNDPLDAEAEKWLRAKDEAMQELYPKPPGPLIITTDHKEERPHRKTGRPRGRPSKDNTQLARTVREVMRRHGVSETDAVHQVADLLVENDHIGRKYAREVVRAALNKIGG